MSERLVSATIAELFTKAGEQWGSKSAFATRARESQKSTGSTFETISYHCWHERSRALATGLMDLGVKERDHVGLLSDNRFEWILVDAAIQYCGAADVPRASDITSAEMLYILHHADVEVLFVENELVLEKLESIREQLPLLKTIILMDISSKELPEGILFIQEIENHGRALRNEGDRRVEQRVREITPDDFCTIIYTSGTTGIPKGVPITHRSICSQIENITFSLGKKERALSILPIWHSYERIFEMLVISHGATLYYSSIRHLKADLATIKPTVMASAPRLWEALYERIIAHVLTQHGITRFFIYMARDAAAWTRHAIRFFQGCELDLVGRTWLESLLLALKHILRFSLALLPFVVLDVFVLRKLRNVVGGSFRATISGGGALPPYIDAFFNDIGIQIFEGYGLTESSPVLAVRSKAHFVLGTVGPPLPKTEIKINDLVTGTLLYPDTKRTDLGRGRLGEISARGPQIMTGYYKNSQATALVLSDGWLRTGDIGMMTFNNCLKIIGRCKETVVLLSGENIEPLPIESRLLESPFIEQCMIVGQDQKKLGVLLLPSLSGFRKHGLSASSLEDLLEEKELRPLLQGEVRRLISEANGFKRFERIGCIELLTKPFEIGEELTSTYKLKRHVIMERYQQLIKKMYEKNDA